MHVGLTIFIIKLLLRLKLQTQGIDGGAFVFIDEHLSALTASAIDSLHITSRLAA